LQALALATGRDLTGEHVFERVRVLVVSLEDGAKELRRRVLAARLHYNIPLADLDGWLFLAAPGGEAGKLMITGKHGHAIVGALAAHLESEIVAHSIGLLMIDPFVKTHGIPENDNTGMDSVAQLLTDLAIRFNIAIDVPHHISKGMAEPGNADRGRGASSVAAAGRLIYTATAMQSGEAANFGISDEQRKEYFRVDSAKVNITRGSKPANWFHLIGVSLGNPTTLYPNGDEVHTVEPWSPPDAWAGLSIATLNTILDAIDAGIRDEDGQPTGEHFSNAPAATDRAVWPIVQRFAPDKTEGQCRTVIHQWLDNGVLVPKDYHSPSARKTRKGLTVDAAKRPGRTETET
jgi:AAA domain